MVELSIVIPVYNEEKNVMLLYKEVAHVLSRMKKSFEIIFVNDGSSDNTFANLKKLHALDKRVKVISFRKNFGQTAGLSAGFDHANGKIVISMDGDLQDNPNYIPQMLDKLKREDYDAVCAWRYKRAETFSKKLFSKFAGALRYALTKQRIHDSGCQFRVYKNECVKNLGLYGEMHRYIPYIMIYKGFKVGELKVKQRKRVHGRTKYNIKRLPKGFLDLMLIKFWSDYSARPIHLFGGFGIFFLGVGFIIDLYLIILKIFIGQSLSDRPLLLLGSVLMIIGIQFIFFGFLADIMIKSYFENKPSYNIEKFLK